MTLPLPLPFPAAAPTTCGAISSGFSSASASFSPNSPSLAVSPKQQEPPPTQVPTKVCSISSVFGKLLAVKTAPACRAGCAGGKCPPDWMPGTSDQCSAPCGQVFEPFWDECGKMLMESKMGGMKEMGVFYNRCLKSLYPPGTCGAYCNAHTYDCYLKEVKQACCDEGGANCPAGQPVPSTCPVGCALVFPEFLETCRTHIKQQKTLQIARFEGFEKKCLAVDSLALVEYAMELRAQGCTIDLVGHRRRTQTYLGQWIGSRAKKCGWDQIDDYAQQVDHICCGAGGLRCRGGAPPSGKCTAACAVAAHAFATDCSATLKVIMPGVTDPRRLGILRFESGCIKSVDPKFFLKAIMQAKCPKNVHTVTKPVPTHHADPCTSSPCQHGGVCHDHSGTWACECAEVVNRRTGRRAGWTGKRCEAQANLCSVLEDDCDPLYARCQHLGPGRHSCTCGIGWAGDGHICRDIDECASNPCPKGTRCTQSSCSPSSFPRGTKCDPKSRGLPPVDSYACSVSAGQPHADPCASSPCQHGATCTSSVTAYACACVGGFTSGSLGACERDVDECASSPCKNGATCTDSTVEPSVSVSAYQCTCVAGFANGVCEYLKNPKRAVAHGHDFINQYTTECTVTESSASATLSGSCDIDVDECKSSPCKNGATCTESSADATVPFHAYRCKSAASAMNKPADLYAYVATPMSWAAARSYCRKHFHDLASFHCAAQQQAVASVIKAQATTLSSGLCLNTKQRGQYRWPLKGRFKTASQCRQKCRGFKYMSLECPTPGGFECWCVPDYVNDAPCPPCTSHCASIRQPLVPQVRAGLHEEGRNASAAAR
eukprot:COSAG01_NODE_4788_length_4743_cov_45.744832_2_plen_830_part_00